MTGYTLLLDDSYDPAADIYVMGGAIIETSRLCKLADAVSHLAWELTGDETTELKYTEEQDLVGRLRAKGNTIGASRWKMAGLPAAVGGITFVASIIVDPTADPDGGAIDPLSWSFQRSVTHFTNFLSDAGTAWPAGSHGITVDRLPKKHESVFHEAYRRSYRRTPVGNPAATLGVQPWLHEADATYCAPLQLADNFAGAVRRWAMDERRYDFDPGARTGKATASGRRLLNRYLPAVRGAPYNANRKTGFGLAIWPRQHDPQLDLWVARTRGERVDESFVPVHMDVRVEADGNRVLWMNPGTRRSYE